MTTPEPAATDPEEWPFLTGSHSSCPRCGDPDVRLRQVLRCNRPGTSSLAGAQMKLTARPGWEYRCFACGDTGPCEIRESVTARLAREAAAAEDTAAASNDYRIGWIVKKDSTPATATAETAHNHSRIVSPACMMRR